ncbi:helix-turn-helix domain-containing protein [Salarchaeum sp. III]|uniref:TrmB family transcriptional regulator n=1 Tax=Salarchaeum sp. III TaxID=3107927 RepID=UPI002ED8EFFF
MSRLTELGLSAYEEKAYRSLLGRGPLTARGVSEASGVPMGRVYDVLNGLAARDLVTSRGDDPTRYTAVDPKAATDRLLAERQRELDERAARYERLADELGSELTAVAPSEGRFWTAPLGSDAAVSLTRRAFANADETVRSAMAEPYAAAPWERYEPEMRAFDETLGTHTVRALIDERVLDGAPRRVRERYRDREEVDIRVTTDLAVTFDLVDDASAYVHFPHPLDDGDRLGAVEVRDGDLLVRLSDLFERAWTAADPLD